MQIIQQTVDVQFRYPVAFTRHLFRPDNALLKDVTAASTHTPARLLAVVDQGIAEAHPSLLDDLTAYCRHHSDSLHLARPPLLLPGGEQAKNDPGFVHAVQEAIHASGIDRHSYVIAVGGGAVLDVVGYAAATAHRGVRLLRVPTTVLAQGDSGMGVKNGINYFGKKNFLGTFTPPYAVLNDVHFLTTLEDRDWRGGLSEAVKVALVKDAAFFDFIEAQATALVARDLDVMQQVVYRGARLHLAHIATSGDPFELGSSRPLDFGHWAAHKLEQLTDFAVRHGEAVAIGIALDATYAHRKGFLRRADWLRIIRLFTSLNLDVYHPYLSRHLDAPSDPRCVLAGLDEFREHLGGQLTIMLLSGIGAGFEVHEMDHALVIESIGMLHALASQFNPETSAWTDTATPVPSPSNS